MKTCAKKGRNFNSIDLATFICADEEANISSKSPAFANTFLFVRATVYPGYAVKAIF